MGVLVANIDMTLLLATYPQISSGFGALSQGSWLLTAYMLSMCATQPLYGKLSGIFGTKAMLLLSYVLYATGSAICALGQSMWQVVLGRVVAGMGGAGMVCLVSILITGLVPLRQVAEYRSYVNIIQTLGRSIGAPMGGFVTERLGWRFTFAALCATTITGIAIVGWKLEDQPGELAPSLTEGVRVRDSYWVLLKRVDMFGAFILACTITAALVFFTLGGQKLPWSSPIMIAILATAFSVAVAFYVWETRYACEPIFPPSLLVHNAVWTSYLLILLQNAAQSAATLSVPMFFQVTRGLDASAAGVFLLPSVVGNTLGALATGNYIKRTGRYKIAGVVSGILGVIGYSLMIARWDATPAFNPLWDDSYLVFAGAATGMSHSAAFVVLTAGIAALEGDKDNSNVSDNTGIASSGIYLSGNIGGVLGLALSSTVLHTILRSELSGSLDEATMRKAMGDIGFVQGLERGSRLWTVVVSAYVEGFRGTFWEAATCSALTIFVGLMVIEQNLQD